MSLQLLVNLFIACLWMLLNDEWSYFNFTVGYMIGLLVIFLMRRFFPTKFYLKRVFAMFKFLIVVMNELISSSIFVIKFALNPRIIFIPGIFELRTVLESDWEVTILSLLITLTPGSVVIEISPDKKLLYIHAMDMPSVTSTVIKSIHAFEKAIMEVTRDV